MKTSFITLRNLISLYFPPYVHPQETSNKTDVRWFTIFNKSGKGIRVQSDIPFSISALHYFTEDLDDGDAKRQRHAADIKPRPQTQLNIDLKQMGVGGIDSWQSWPMPPYRLSYGNYQFSYLIKPL
jgi:beta-galactosidase